MVKTSRREELEEKAMEEEKGDLNRENIHLGFHRDALAWLVVGLVIGHLL